MSIREEAQLIVDKWPDEAHSVIQANRVLRLLDAIEDRMSCAKAGEYIWWEDVLKKAEEVDNA